MFTISPSAAHEILAAVERSGAAGLALRVAAQAEADGSIRFGMGFDEPREGDLPLDIEGISIVIGGPSQALLQDARLDLVEVEPGRQGFVVVPQSAPEEPATGCGSGGCGSCEA